MCGRLDDDRSRHNGAVAIDVPRVRVTVARDDARSKSPGAADHRNGATAADWIGTERHPRDRGVDHPLNEHGWRARHGSRDHVGADRRGFAS